jgi:hypothetical protein
MLASALYSRSSLTIFVLPLFYCNLKHRFVHADISFGYRLYKSRVGLRTCSLVKQLSEYSFRIARYAYKYRPKLIIVLVTKLPSVFYQLLDYSCVTALRSLV